MRGDAAGAAAARRRAGGPRRRGPRRGPRPPCILLHGRGATAESILDLAAEVAPAGLAYLAPQAAGNTWYPYSFLAPIASNEPGLSSGLAALGDVARGSWQRRASRRSARSLLGFSQGACLTLEFAARTRPALRRRRRASAAG